MSALTIFYILDISFWNCISIKCQQFSQGTSKRWVVVNQGVYLTPPLGSCLMVNSINIQMNTFWEENYPRYLTLFIKFLWNFIFSVCCVFFWWIVYYSVIEYKKGTQKDAFFGGLTKLLWMKMGVSKGWVGDKILFL